MGDEEGGFIKSDYVGDLIDEERREWRVDVVEGNFNDRDQRCILAMPLISRNIKDEMT